MAACDRYFDLSRLFHGYYEKLGSDTFFALSVERKSDALDELVRIGADVRGAWQDIQTAMQGSDRSRKIHARVQTQLEEIQKRHEKQ